MDNSRVAVTAETLELLRQASTATITTELFRHGLRNAFLAGLRPLNPHVARFAGEAFTLRHIPAREDLDVPGVTANPEHPQRKAFETVGPGQVLVMDCRGEIRNACGGQILITRMMKRGAAALVTDGALRDSPGLAQMDFPVFAGGVAATLSLARHHAVDLQVPVCCAGVPVYPGDILVGDEEGVVCVPRHLAAEIAAPAAQRERLEEFLLAKVEEGAPLRGTYPPDERTLAEYEAWRRRRGS
ncbi:MAG: ribonuclease activity regulator RraA [Armatimonadetes bacterium]|nr:ribonuclease activity regulator RraA [Armatimonadota bacterium]